LPYSRKRNYCEIYEQILRNGRPVVVILWFGKIMSANIRSPPLCRQSSSAKGLGPWTVCSAARNK